MQLSRFYKNQSPFRWLSWGVPPVLIPNTEVKPSYTDSTVLATAWEDRQLPDPKETVERLFLFVPVFLLNSEYFQAKFSCGWDAFEIKKAIQLICRTALLCLKTWRLNRSKRQPGLPKGFRMRKAAGTQASAWWWRAARSGCAALNPKTELLISWQTQALRMQRLICSAIIIKNSIMTWSLCFQTESETQHGGVFPAVLFAAKFSASYIYLRKLWTVPKNVNLPPFFIKRNNRILFECCWQPLNTVLKCK